MKKCSKQLFVIDGLASVGYRTKLLANVVYISVAWLLKVLRNHAADPLFTHLNICVSLLVSQKHLFFPHTRNEGLVPLPLSPSLPVPARGVASCGQLCLAQRSSVFGELPTLILSANALLPLPGRTVLPL